MSTQPAEELETIYNNYQEEAGRINQARMRAFILYRLVALIGIVIMVLSLLGKMSPSAFWGGAILTLVIIFAGIVITNARAKKEAEGSAQSRPGFGEFYRLYANGRYWPHQIEAGEKYDKFLSILGRKASQ